jgi:Domain of Unknown Function (DUF928)
MTKFFFHSFLSGTITAVLFLTSNPARANSSLQTGETLRDDSLIGLQFSLPADRVPKTSIGGGVRGNTQFTLPNGGTPRTSIGGGVRGNTQFTLPNGGTPRTSIGGGVRGNTQFTLPGGARPRTSIGAGVRGNVQFTLPGGARPRTSVGAGVRGDEEIPVLTALVPSTQHGRTISARPTIFVYLPPTGAQEVFFSLQDEQGNPFYHTTVKVPLEGGTIAIALPADAPELKLGKNYLWYLAPIEPGAILRPDNYAVTGWITRVESTVNQSALASSPIELATAYAKAGIWYDTLKVLADAKRSAPNDKTLVKEWQDLLDQVGLDAIANQPLAN